MAHQMPDVSRRGFLKGSGMTVAALALADRAVQPFLESLTRLGLALPWYRQGQVTTTYN